MGLWLSFGLACVISTELYSYKKGLYELGNNVDLEAMWVEKIVYFLFMKTFNELIFV